MKIDMMLRLNNKFRQSNFLYPFLIAGVFLLVQCKKDGSVENKQALSLPGELSATPPTSAEGYNVENALPSGFKKDGTVDYTRYIQKAISQNSKIVFPGYPLLVNDSGLVVGSNKTITFLKGSRILLKPSEKPSYAVIRIRNVSNVTLNYPFIDADKYTHKGTTGQYGHGISIVSSSNITLIAPLVYRCWGDGIYLGSSGTVINKNIKISNAYCRDNRRDGMSVLCVDGLTLTNSYFGYNAGSSPETGLNFEPSNNSQELKNIRVRNVKTEGNGRYGILVMFNYLYGAGNKQIGIDINGHNDYKSNVSFKAACLTTNRTNGETITGNLNITQPYWRESRTRPLTTTLNDKNVKLNITNPQVLLSTGEHYANQAARDYLLSTGSINSGASYSFIFR